MHVNHVLTPLSASSYHPLFSSDVAFECFVTNLSGIVTGGSNVSIFSLNRTQVVKPWMLASTCSDRFRGETSVDRRLIHRLIHLFFVDDTTTIIIQVSDGARSAWDAPVLRQIPEVCERQGAVITLVNHVRL